MNTDSVVPESESSTNVQETVQDDYIQSYGLKVPFNEASVSGNHEPLDITGSMDSSDAYSSEGCHKDQDESHTTHESNYEKTITCEHSVATEDQSSLHSTDSILADEGIHNPLVSLDGHAPNQQQLPTVAMTSFCDGNELSGELTAAVRPFQSPSPSLSESVNVFYFLDAPCNSVENLSSGYIANENNSNTGMSPIIGGSIAIPSGVSMSDTDNSFDVEPELRTEQQEQHFNEDSGVPVVSSHHCGGYVPNTFFSTSHSRDLINSTV